MDHHHVVKLLNVTHCHQIIRIPKFSLQTELSSDQRQRYSVHVVINSMDQTSLHAQLPDNGVAQFQIVLKMRPQQFAYRHPLCQQQLSLELDHHNHREKHQLPCEQVVVSLQHHLSLQQRKQFQSFQLILIRKKIKMIAIYFLAQFVKNIQGADQWSQYQRIITILSNLHLQQPQQRHEEQKQQRKIFRRKLTQHIQVTMKWQEHITMCKYKKKLCNQLIFNNFIQFSKAIIILMMWIFQRH